MFDPEALLPTKMIRGKYEEFCNEIRTAVKHDFGI